MKPVFFKHLVVWLLYLAIQVVAILLNYWGNWIILFDSLFQNCLYIALFYCIYFSVFKGFAGHKNILIALANYLLCFAVILFTVHFAFSYGLPLLGNRTTYSTNYRINRFLISDVLTNFFSFSLYAFLFWQFNKRVQAEKVLQVAQAEKFQLSNEKLKTEYDYLKSQINPHFLYNTLGYFYAKMLRLDKPAAEGLATLSDLMRYSLDTGDTNGKVFLREEVQQVKNYIDLQQLRFNHALHIRFTHNEIPESMRIIPHALITLVENAFKYGDASNAEFPIQIALTVENKGIRFVVTNQISHKSKDRSSTGIGLKNLVQRLALEYPGNHHYRVHANNDLYETCLEILEK